MIVQYLARKPEEDSEPGAKDGGSEAKPADNQPAKVEH